MFNSNLIYTIFFKTDYFFPTHIIGVLLIPLSEYEKKTLTVFNHSRSLATNLTLVIYWGMEKRVTAQRVQAIYAYWGAIRTRAAELTIRFIAILWLLPTTNHLLVLICFLPHNTRRNFHRDKARRINNKRAQVKVF